MISFIVGWNESKTDVHVHSRSWWYFSNEAFHLIYVLQVDEYDEIEKQLNIPKEHDTKLNQLLSLYIGRNGTFLSHCQIYSALYILKKDWFSVFVVRVSAVTSEDCGLNPQLSHTKDLYPYPLCLALSNTDMDWCTYTSSCFTPQKEG